MRNYKRVTPQEKIDENVIRIPESTCWYWNAGVSAAGYGTMHVGFGRTGSKKKYAHRISYELAKGPIPDGLHVDHLCRQRLCVNPDHLEAVTFSENVRRGLSGVLHVPQKYCLRGHLRTPGVRKCLECWKTVHMPNRDRKRKAARDL